MAVLLKLTPFVTEDSETGFKFCREELLFDIRHSVLSIILSFAVLTIEFHISIEK